MVRPPACQDPKPADWLWQYPTDTGKGDDNMVRYPDHGPHRHCLVRDICAGLMANSGALINRF